MIEELEKIDNVEEVETIPTDKENVEQSTGEVSGEVTEPEDNSAEIEAEQERLRREHEEYLNSFPETTVFYRDLLVKDNVKSLGTVVRDPHIAEQWGFLDNHFDESELTYIGTPECGTYYLKDFTPEPDTPEQRRAKFIATRKSEIVTAVQEQLDATAQSKGYDNGEMLATYATDPDPEFGTQGRAYVAWRGKCWRKCYDILDQVLAGELEPEDVTVSFVLGALPPLEW